MFILIAAIGPNRELGFKGVMPWHNTEDLQHFKNTTYHSKVVFGRNTYVNLPKKLVNREIYVVSCNYEDTNVHVINDFELFLNKHQHSPEIYYIAGGAKIYQQALPYCNELLISQMNYEGPADTYFPEIDESLYTKELIEFETFTLAHYTRKEGEY